MCRILSVSGKIEKKDLRSVLIKFQHLAEHGNVPIGLKKGHKDGWGVVAYKNGKPTIFVRDCGSAFGDFGYSRMTRGLQVAQPDIIIGHLRKISVGVKSINNTQPFVSGIYSFCHNGTILNSEGICLKNYFKLMAKGETDSEKMFLRILQSLIKNKKITPSLIRESIKRTVCYIRKNFDFTALNTIFSDGNHVWALREVNEKNKNVKKMKMIDYYSLFVSVNKDYQLVVSEKLDLKDIKWKKIYNHELIEINPVTHKVRGSII